MNTHTKTLSVRVKDKHSAILNKMAFDVNQVWNAANAESDAYGWVPIPEVGYMNLGGISAFDLQKELKGIREDRDMDIGSTTFQEVIAVHAKTRKQFKKNKLKWRISGGSKRSLGWVPFKIGAAKWVNGQVKFSGRYFKVWDSYSLSDFDFRSGSFSQDSRGRWYFNIVVHAQIKQTKGKGQIGIDLGLKTTAVCSDGTTLERQDIYRNAEEKLGNAQRANKKKQVKNIHAKIKNKRKDVLHKFSTKLVEENEIIVVGNVSSSGLAKTKMAKSVLDAGWSMLRTQLEYKANARRVVFIEVNEAYSTQTCSGCGIKSGPKGLSGLNKRIWQCSECYTDHERDVNSAINILAVGYGSLAEGITEPLGR